MFGPLAVDPGVTAGLHVAEVPEPVLDVELPDRLQLLVGELCAELGDRALLGVRDVLEFLRVGLQVVQLRSPVPVRELDVLVAVRPEATLPVGLAEQARPAGAEVRRPVLDLPGGQQRLAVDAVGSREVEQTNGTFVTKSKNVSPWLSSM